MSEALDAFERAIGSWPSPTLKPRARELLSAAQWAGELEPRLKTNYLVKSVLNAGDLGMVYGPSNVGKSFFVTELAKAVDSGTEFFGRRVRRARALYVLAEGGAGFDNRAVAAGAKFWVLRAPVVLTGPRADTAALCEVTRHLAGLHGQFGLIVLDTLARAMGAADENDAASIGDLVRNADILRAATGAAVLAVHHSGKDAAKGARGHSALRAAVDTEIALTRADDGLITARIAKQRDGRTGDELRFRLRRVELGVDDDGDPVATCVVAPADEEATPSHGRELTEAERVAMRALEELTRAGGPVALAAWRDAAIAAGVSSARDRAAQRATFAKVRDRLAERGLVRGDGETVRLGGGA